MNPMDIFTGGLLTVLLPNVDPYWRLVITLVVVGLGAWQLVRHVRRTDRAALVTQLAQFEEVRVAAILSMQAEVDHARAELRQVKVEGRAEAEYIRARMVEIDRECEACAEKLAKATDRAHRAEYLAQIRTHERNGARQIAESLARLSQQEFPLRQEIPLWDSYDPKKGYE